MPEAPVPRLLRLGRASIDLETGEIRRNGARAGQLTTLERKVLAHLAARPLRDTSQEELLREVWGYRPGVVSRAAYFTLRRLRQEVEDDPAQPRHLVTVHGVGYRFVPPEPSSAEAPAAPALPALAARHNLSPEPTPFVGRAAERARLWARLPERPRLITLTGPGGMGKTRLSLELALAWLEKDLGEAWLAPLADARSLGDVVASVATALGVPLRPEEPVAAGIDQIGRALSRRGPTLLVLDNAEHLTAVVVPPVREWLVAAPGLSVLVTSRVRLRIAGEVLERLGPLAQDEAVALLVARARDHGVELDPADASVEALAQRLDGLPLALELAAGRLPTLSPTALLRRLDDRLTLLRGPTRHRADSLRAALESSWDLLDPGDAQTFARLSVFEGGFWLEDAEAVLGPAVLDAVERLVDASLLAVAPHPRVPELRFRMLETVALFAGQKLTDLPDRAHLVDRHARHVAARGAALADRATLSCEPLAGVHLALLRPDLLRAAEHADPALALTALRALCALATLRGPAADLERFRRTGRERARACGSPDLPAWVGTCALGAGGEALSEALTTAEACVRELVSTGQAELARDLGPALILRACTVGRLDLSRRVLDALAALPPAADPRVRWRLGQVALGLHASAGDDEAAEATARQVARLVAEHGWERLPYLNLGAWASRTGDPRTAARRYVHDLEIHTDADAPAHAARLRMNLAIAYANLDDPRCVHEATRAEALLVRSGSTGGLPLLTSNQASFHLFRGELAAAAERARTARDLASASGNAHVIAEAEHVLAWVCFLRGETAPCLHHHRDAIAASAPTGHTPQLAELRAHAALHAARLGERAAAAAWLPAPSGDLDEGRGRPGVALALAEARACLDPAGAAHRDALRRAATTPDASGDTPAARSAMVRLLLSAGATG